MWIWRVGRRDSRGVSFHPRPLDPIVGGEIKQITINADSVAVATIAFSPDGSRIAYFSDHAIKVVPVQGGRSEVLLEVGNLGDFPDLAWSPDGQTIAFVASWPREDEFWLISDFLPEER
jgi:WD40 repeat protein